MLNMGLETTTPIAIPTELAGHLVMNLPMSFTTLLHLYPFRVRHQLDNHIVMQQSIPYQSQWTTCATHPLTPTELVAIEVNQGEKCAPFGTKTHDSWKLDFSLNKLAGHLVMSLSFTTDSSSTLLFYDKLQSSLVKWLNKIQIRIHLVSSLKLMCWIFDCEASVISRMKV